MDDALIIASGLGFIFLMTCLGGGVVVFFKRGGSGTLSNVMLGFAAGIMVAAAIWSLLIPSIEASTQAGQIAWIPAAGGFVLGVLFLLMLDRIIPHLHPQTNTMEGAGGGLARAKRSTLLVLAVTLHNIPEGMAVGLSFALAVQNPGDPVLLSAAMALAAGIGIQNFPEGAAISLPLREDGVSRGKAWLMACGSGAVEPVFGLLTVLLSALIAPFMPWLLAFAAGAMMYVVVEELIPEANLSKHANLGTLGVMAGFLVMMVLDVALG